jgi:addiction module RelB/DinJ family antitoxin
MLTNTKTVLTVKIDKELKLRAQKTAASFGLPLGTMVNSLLSDVVRSGRLELELHPTPRLKRSIAEAEREYKSGKLKKFSSMKKMLADLNS